MTSKYKKTLFSGQAEDPETPFSPWFGFPAHVLLRAPLLSDGWLLDKVFYSSLILLQEMSVHTRKLIFKFNCSRQTAPLNYYNNMIGIKLSKIKWF